MCVQESARNISMKLPKSTSRPDTVEDDAVRGGKAGVLTSNRRYAKEIAMNVNWEGREYIFEKPMLVSRLLEELAISKEGHLVVANRRPSPSGER